MFGKEGPAKVHQIRNGTVVGICPPGGEFKAVAGAFPFLDAPFRCLPDMCGPCGVAVILGMCAVGDNKKLHVFSMSRGLVHKRNTIFVLFRIKMAQSK